MIAAPVADETERARSALAALDPGCPRSEWVRLGMAAQAAGLDFHDWHDWSAAAGNYRSEADCRSTWNSFRGEGVGAGTLFAAARAAGWRDDQMAPLAGVKITQGPPAAPAPARPAPDAAALWASFCLAPPDHSYLLRKGMAGDGLRVAPAGVAVAGRSCAGWLALPVWSIEHGELQSIQFVSPEAGPPKLSLPGARISGGAMVVHHAAPEGRPTPAAFADGVAYLAEGTATAASLYQATGHPAVATFGKSNLDTVARALRRQYPDLRLVLAPDRGGEPQAAAIAAGIGGPVAWVELPAELPQNADANDYAAAHGIDGLAALLRVERTPPQRFQLLSAADLGALPALRWRIRGVLPQEGLAAIYGPPGSGKTFLAWDLLAAVAAGREWFGCRTHTAPVLYVGLEGAAGLPQRQQAHAARHGHSEGMRFLLSPLDLRRAQDRADLVAAARAAGLAGGVLCIDTLAAAAPGMDENASADMGEAIAALKALQADLGGLMLVVHHAGKDSTKGLRGHSSLLAAMDAVIEVTRTDGRREWKLAKAKDGADGEARQFQLEVVELGTDAEGEPATSCVVEPDEHPAALVRRAAPPAGGNMRLAFTAIVSALKDARAYGQASAPPGRPCIDLEAAIAAAASALPCEPKRKRERAQAAITGLVSRQNLAHSEGWIWLP